MDTGFRSGREVNRVFAYARGSTNEQVITLQAQERILVDYYNRVLSDKYEWGGCFCESHSSKDAFEDRPEASQVLRLVRRGDAIVVTKIDRLARSLKHAILFVDELEKRGVDLIMLDPQVDTSSPTGRLFFRIMASVAEFERDMIRSRTRDALEENMRQRKRISAHPPIGWKFVVNGSGDVITVPCPQERSKAEEIASFRRLHRLEVKNLRSSGFKTKRLGQALVERGLVFRGKPVTDERRLERIEQAVRAGFPITSARRKSRSAG